MSGLRVLFSAGSDVHPFDRLVSWADRWAEAHPDDEVLVQHGSTSPPTVAEGRQMFARDEMLERLGAADVVVLSCGPGAVMDARRVGRLPIVVPRQRGLGEHVDDHQLVFARHLQRHGLAVLVEDEESLGLQLERARREPNAFRVENVGGEPPGVGRLAALIDELVLGPIRPERGRSTT